VQREVPIQERQMPPRFINAIMLDNVTISVSPAVLYRIADASRTVHRTYAVATHNRSDSPR
jgi:hypothetical protein